MATVESYDVVSDTWRHHSDMPSAHCSCAYVARDNKLYVIGGLSLSGATNCISIFSPL